ncbi:MAG: hypothetical protein OXN91_01540 [Chloroflexota bacterium]|nr:hypothetical protein [Chloroflexota bacterium]
MSSYLPFVVGVSVGWRAAPRGWWPPRVGTARVDRHGHWDARWSA